MAFMESPPSSWCRQHFMEQQEQQIRIQFYSWHQCVVKTVVSAVLMGRMLEALGDDEGLTWCIGPSQVRHDVCLCLSQREEIQRLCGDRTLLQSSGTTLGGIKCIIIRDNMDDDKEPTLHMQTKPDSDGNSNFIVVAKSHKGKRLCQWCLSE